LYKALKQIDSKTLRKLNLHGAVLVVGGKIELKRLKTSKIVEIKTYSTMDGESIAKVSQNADRLVFSSISDGMPVSVNVALASGVPLFTINCGGFDDVINDSNGRIYPIMDYKGLSDVILNTIRDYLNSIGCEINSQILSRFGELPFRDRLIENYENAL
jgi:glycosyltransferase involved in cell wall biosynthesis